MNLLTDNPGGIELLIGDVPGAIVNNHNEAFYYWEEAGLKDATLLHVDAHHDMSDGTIVKDPLNPYLQLSITNFISAAFHYGIVSSIYWFNPHSTQKYLQYLGGRNENARKKLQTKEIDAHAFELWVRILWSQEACGSNVHNGLVISEDELDLGKKYILDIDLDAFCCDRTIHGVYDWDYNGVDGFKGRIEQLTGLLRPKPKPQLVTIARSQGNLPEPDKTYVPPHFVEVVQTELLGRLCQLYETV